MLFRSIDAVFPQAVNQTCIVHLVRQSLRYLSWRERKSCAGELRRIYTAADPDAARAVLDELTAAWADSKTRTAALQVWERAWERVIPFLAFPDEIRRIVYTTDESVKGTERAGGGLERRFRRMAWSRCVLAGAEIGSYRVALSPIGRFRARDVVRGPISGVARAGVGALSGR